MRSASRGVRTDQYDEAVDWFVATARYYGDGATIPRLGAIRNDIHTVARRGGLRRLALEAIANGRVVAIWWAVEDGMRLELCGPDRLPAMHLLARCSFRIVLYGEESRQFDDLSLEWLEVTDARCKFREGVVTALPRRSGASGAIRYTSGKIELLAQEARGLAVRDKVKFTIGRTIKTGRRIALRVTRATSPSSDVLDPLPAGRTPHVSGDCSASERVLPSRFASRVDQPRKPTGLRLLYEVGRAFRAVLDEVATGLTKVTARAVVTSVTILIIALTSLLLYRFGVN